MKFQWDPKKAAANVRRHGVSFDEASTVFGDPLAGTVSDPDHSTDESRFVTMGHSSKGRLLVVVHADRADDVRSLLPAGLLPARRRSMRKAKGRVGEDGMRAEYDFSGAVRGKYYERYRASSNVVVLDPDVSEVFPNADSVNDALRALASVVRARAPPPKRASRTRGGRTRR